MSNPSSASADKLKAALPKHRSLYYAGGWQEPLGGYLQTVNPATGESLGQAAEANAQDVDKAVRAAHQAFLEWRRFKPRERGALLKKVAAVLRTHAEELALLDAANCGNPVKAMIRDGYLVERRKGEIWLCVRGRYGWSWQQITQKDLKSGRVPRLVAERQSKPY